jgi:predicted permease
MFSHLIQALCVLLGLILSAVWLRRRGGISEGDAPALTRVVMDLLLPAVVFSTLSRNPLSAELIPPGLIMLAAVIIGLVLAWIIGRLMRLAPRRLGALILVAGFGSSASVGYVLIGQVFPSSGAAMVDAVVINTIGSTLPVFVIGIPIAAYFGGGASAGSGVRIVVSAMRDFLVSPLFFAILFGVALSFVKLGNNPIVATLYQFLDALQGALMFVVALTIGLMLRPVSITEIGRALLAVVAIKLLVEPWLVAELARVDRVAHLGLEVLAIEAAMPSGTIAAVVAARYGCDGTFASALVLLTYGLSLVTTPLAVYLLA